MRRIIPADRLDGLTSPTQGLTAAQAEARARFGPNDILEAPGGGWRALARDTARDPMIWFLFGTALLFSALGQAVEAATLLAAIVPLVGMDAYLHRRTRASTEGLASRLASTAQVHRDGALRTLPARTLVPGDLIRVAAGESLPADGLIVAGDAVQADESTLTGESFPVAKRPLPLCDHFPPDADERHWLAAGTRLLAGQAWVRVAFIGGETRYGEIVRSAKESAHARTPLQRAIAHLIAVLLKVAVSACLLLAAVRLGQGYGLVDAVLSGVTLAVAALPEEFPVVFTFFLGVGVYRLARRRALVRRAVAVENIGRVTCICSDKTGTITAGELVLAHREAAPPLDDEALLRVAALAARTEGADPLDAALVAAAGRRVDGMVRMALFPFTEQRRRETAVWRDPRGPIVAVAKGAPETILSLCDLPAVSVRAWRERVESYAASGHKVIACAQRHLPPDADPAAEPSHGFRFAGLLAFEDPVRDGVREAVAECRAAGIRVVMVTGDHPATALAIARGIGLGGAAPRVVTMDPDEGLAQISTLPADVDVVARAVPWQKLELVRTLQAGGEIVAVTGDGVNDVPALQAADIGIAMGERGTRSARETAAIVLLDDNFRTIVRAIAEGRQLFRNLQLSFAYLLMVHIPLVASATLVPLTGGPLLYLPIHIVWLELLIHPTALLVFQELPQTGPLSRQGGHAHLRFFTPRAWYAIGAGGALITLVMLWAYYHALAEVQNVAHARAMALASLIIAGATLTASLSRLRTAAAAMLAIAGPASLLVCVQIPVLAAFLQLTPLHVTDWGIAAGAGALAGAVGTGILRLLGRHPRTGAPRAGRQGGSTA